MANERDGSCSSCDGTGAVEARGVDVDYECHDCEGTGVERPVCDDCGDEHENCGAPDAVRGGDRNFDLTDVDGVRW